MNTSLDPSTLFAAPPPPSSLSSRANGSAGNISPAGAKAAASKGPGSAPRIDLEPLYAALKATITEYWAEYKDAVALFVIGKLNLSEFALRTDHFLTGDPQVEHLHNRLIAGILANVGRESPDVGVAPWVSANERPIAGLNKSTTGNEVESRLKTEVMQLPARERRRLKDITEPEARNPVPPTVLAFHNAKVLKPPSDIPPASAGGLNRTNWELEIRKRFNQPLAAETGEFPDADAVSSRMTPICFEHGLPSGASTTCSGFLATAAEYYIKDVLSNMYIKTRLNMTGGSVTGAMTNRFKQIFAREEEAASSGELGRVGGPGGLLPIEAKEAVNRRPLGISDLKMAIRTGDSSMGQFQFVQAAITQSGPDGEYEEYQALRKEIEKEARQEEDNKKRARKLFEDAAKLWALEDPDTEMNGVEQTNGSHSTANPQAEGESVLHSGFAQFDGSDTYGWPGGSRNDRLALSTVLDEVLNVS